MTGRGHLVIGVGAAAAAGIPLGLPPLAVLGAGAVLLTRRRSLPFTIVAIAAIAAANGMPPGVLGTFLTGALLGAIAPDIDHAYGLVARASARALGAALVVLSCAATLWTPNVPAWAAALPGAVGILAVLRPSWMPLTLWIYRAVLSNPLTWLFVGRERMRALVTHRKLSHTVFALLLWTAAMVGGLWVLAPWVPPVVWPYLGGTVSLVGHVGLDARMGTMLLWGYAVAVGYTSHLLGDAATVSRIQPWLPFSDARFQVLPSPLLLRTGGRH
ncbi:MAG: metal-dependent hydrolase [Gemmatimonadaceae bacterium]